MSSRELLMGVVASTQNPIRQHHMHFEFQKWGKNETSFPTNKSVEW